VLESSGENRLDYLGDGVIRMRGEEFAGRRLRLMAVDKLRGTEIHQHKYVFTLKDGRVKAFPAAAVPATPKTKRWSSVADMGKDVVSTGHEDLDGLTGGLPRGRVSMLEIGNNVPGPHVDLLLAGLVSNFLGQGRGVAYIPPGRASGDLVRDAVEPYVGKEAFAEGLTLFETAPGEGSEAGVKTIQLEGTKVESDLRWNNVEYNLGKAKHPFLALVAFDTLESVYPGQDVVSGLTGPLASLRRNRDVFVALTYPQARSAAALANLSAVHLRIENVDGCLLLYGQKPFTGLHNLVFDLAGGYPKAHLTPVV
jgi:hypothetical protein